MGSYELMPDGTEVDVADVIDDLESRGDPVIDLIIHQWKIYVDGHRIFMNIHNERRDPDDMGRLGLAKLFRAKRDCCAELLTQIALQIANEELTDDRTDRGLPRMVHR